MKIILSVLFVFIGFGYANAETAAVSPELAAARAKYDTPFTKKYRPRYEANNTNLSNLMHHAIVDCNKICDENEETKLKHLANAGDMFALAILPYASSVLCESGDCSLTDALKESADKGEKYTAASFAMFQRSESQYDNAIKYSTIAMQQDFYDGYMRLAYAYQQKGDNNNFCLTVKKGYERFNFEFLANYFINTHSEGSKLFFSKCTNNKYDDLLKQIGDEGQLIEGYIDVKNSKYNEAFVRFNQLYKLKNAKKISANAGYCLGMMYATGKGTTKDVEKGQKLLKESFDNGIIYQDLIPQNEMLLPDTLEIISYRSGNCLKIK